MRVVGETRMRKRNVEKSIVRKGILCLVSLLAMQSRKVVGRFTRMQGTRRPMAFV
jgi:hypothetical protein